MDLEPEGIEELWNKTKLGDPVRKLVVDLLSFTLVTPQEEATIALRSRRRARGLYASLAQKCHPHEVIDAFAASIAPEQNHLCVRCHNHPVDTPCYTRQAPSALSKQLIDDMTASPSTQPLEIDGVGGRGGSGS